MLRISVLYLVGLTLSCSCGGRTSNASRPTPTPNSSNAGLPEANPDVGYSGIHTAVGTAIAKAKPLSKPAFNRAPTANPGRPRYVDVGTKVTLDASGSSDPDGDRLSPTWTVKAPVGVAAAPIVGAGNSVASWVPEREGNYLLQLTVTDGHGGSDIRELPLVVTSSAKPAAAAYAGANQTVTVGANVTLDGSSSYNPQGTPLRYTWAMRSKPEGSLAVLTGDRGAKPTFQVDRNGIYLVELSVGNDDFTSLVDTVAVAAEPSAFSHASPAVPAEIVVTTQVVRSHVEPLGMNLSKIAGGTNFATNNYFHGTAFEPLLYRKLIRIDRTGEDARGRWLEWDGDQGPHFWETLGTGFGNGAEVRFYRLVNATGAPLEFKNGLGDAKGADRVAYLGHAKIPDKSTKLPQGGFIPNGENRVYIDQNLKLTRGDYAFLVLKRLSVPAADMHKRVQPNYKGNFNTLRLDAGVDARLEPHRTPLPADFKTPGESCLRVHFEKAGPSRVWQYFFHPFDQREGQWYSQLRPGRTYRFSVWLRHEGKASGNARAIFSGNASYEALSQKTNWVITDKWQQFTYDFNAPQYPIAGSHSGPGLEFTGPGTFYVDNLSLFQFDMNHGFAPNGPNEVSLDAWMNTVPSSGSKPAVRFYPLSYQSSTVENLLGNFDGNPTYSVNDGTFNAASGVTVPALMAWAHKTGNAPGNRVVPFLTFVEEYTEAEWRAIVEYLGVPYDNAVDTPQTKPFAHLRFQQRGHGAPWTDDFREIILEYGNETWHNGAGGFGWDGFGAPGAVHQGGAEYGLFARYLFQEDLAQSPFWSKYRLGDKIKLALGANYSATLDGEASYGEAAVMRNRVTDYLGHANYVGPKWETNDPGKSRFDAHGLQATLVGMEANRELIQASTEASRKLNGTRGLRYSVEAYEGGPSGYWTNKGDAAEIDEQYGKSLAMGVAALDTWLFSSLNGYTHQCYYGFSSGGGWSSHTMPEAGGFRAHPGWLALELRNRFARGQDMLAVNSLKIPAYELAVKGGKERVPLITAYALRDSSSLSVFVLSRKYPGKHDGLDFGNGYTPVTLKLPFAKKPRRITLHKLAHPDGSSADPSENNRQADNVVIYSSEIPVAAYKTDFAINQETGGTRDGMPPGTVYLYVFEQ